jgi:hydrogenase maturation protein HypF
MKNTVALGLDRRVLISPHIGDMDSARSAAVFEETVHSLQKLYSTEAEAVICDAHPGYTSSRWAKRCGLPVVKVYHHRAHASSVYETGDQECAMRLVFTWDGFGYGEDGSLWGGEALLGSPGQWKRFASMRSFHLPGGARAGREPWRSAAALCWESELDCPVVNRAAELLHQAWSRRLNTVQTSSVGRLFDAAAALSGVCSTASHEGQAPMLLEAACDSLPDPVPLPLDQVEGVWISDWRPLLQPLLDGGFSVAERAGLLHTTLAHTLLQQAQCARREYGITAVGLSGGVFQNRVLTEHAIGLLEKDDFDVSLPERVPVNDAGLSFGQVIEFAYRNRTRS